MDIFIAILVLAETVALFASGVWIGAFSSIGSGKVSVFLFENTSYKKLRDSPDAL